mmetsp:Transcript_59932/g.104842  ORF Transcript_59932/g.104842 Transcript_59932/m.104842 type:complete len:488 (-) Transcript_59932:277-1740(-)
MFTMADQCSRQNSSTNAEVDQACADAKGSVAEQCPRQSSSTNSEGSQACPDQSTDAKSSAAEECSRQNSTTDSEADEVSSEHSVDNKLCTSHSNMTSSILGMPPVITQSDLDKTLEGDVMTPWEPKKWKWIKTLAAAAAGEGSVELIASRENQEQTVAVKRLPLSLIRSNPEDFNKNTPDAIERPWTDISIVKHLNKLQLPCICDLLGVFLAQNDQVFIMTSLATRGDLFSWIQDDKSEAGEARETAMRPIVSQMLTGIRWLHNLGIAHRDLSAENVMLTDSDEHGVQVKIIDFGMATLNRMVSKELRGKRSYQAPEMHGAEEYDTFLADNFAVGCIIYCMGVHYYPWETTRPGKDRSTEFARANGLETFLKKKRMPCCKKPIAEVFSECYIEVICGLLHFEPETRYSLGEACFQEPIPLKSLKSKSLWASERDTLSDDSTTCSTLDSLPPYPSEAEEVELDCSVDDQTAQQPKSRMSVWDCRWMLA